MRQPTQHSDQRQKHGRPRIGWYRCAALFFAAGAILLATDQPAGYFWALLVLGLALVTARPRSAVELRERPPRNFGSAVKGRSRAAASLPWRDWS